MISHARLHHRVAARAHLAEMYGDTAAAIALSQAAARRPTSVPETRYSKTKAARLTVEQFGPRPV